MAETGADVSPEALNCLQWGAFANILEMATLGRYSQSNNLATSLLLFDSWGASLSPAAVQLLGDAP
jgi:hypothetical protein